ncbi:MAG TPA: cobalamin-binding protein [Phycisphaerales bacterium]|nr:cobalamin-binding protein [Phycisphaerales bacterium]
MTNRPARMWILAAAAASVAMGSLVLLILGGRSAAPTENPCDRTLRIVSLAPSVTEIVFALGLGDCLVGATEHCNWPSQAKQVERVGGFGTPNMERLLALRPDLVVAAGFTRKESIEALRTAGIGVLDVRIRNFDELFAAITDIGGETKNSSRAEALVATLRAELDAVVQRYAHIPPERRPRVFVEIWHDPLTTAGGTSFLNDLICRAGGINVAAELPQLHPRVNPEKVLEWDPDVIVTAYMGRSGQTVSQVAGRIGWAQIKAVRHGRIIDDVPSDILLRPGPRLVEGVKTLAERLYPTSATTVPAASVSEGACP